MTVRAAPVLLDVESRSRADLRRVGGRLYWEHPSSKILVLVWYDTHDGSAGAWVPTMAWPHEGRVLAAHNAHGFDRFACERYGLVAAEWIDTAQLARRAGLPGALDALGTRWCGVPKDHEASRFTTSLSSVRRPSARPRRDPAAVACPRCGAAVGAPCVGVATVHGARRNAAPLMSTGAYVSPDEWRTLTREEQRERGVQPDLTPDGYARVVQYCAGDVQIMADAWPRLAPWRAVDDDVARLDRTINDRGIAFDRELARRLLAEDARLADVAVREGAAALGMTPDATRAAAMSPAQFTALTGAADAQKATVAAMSHPLATVRTALASIARGKLTAGLARVSADGRLRDALLYHGAHTGRWSGRGFQPQNLPRPHRRYEDARDADGHWPCLRNAGGGYDVDVDAFARDVLAGERCDAHDVALLLRAVLTATPGNALAVCDYSSVEARATAWAAGDTDALAVFRSARDPYKVAATAVYCVDYDDVTKAQRQVGKVCELALGYQGGPNAFASMARVYGIALDELDLGAIVAAWRTLHAPVTALWRACQRAFRSACEGRPQWAGPFEYVPATGGDDAVACFLPSGRPIVYNEARAGVGDDGRPSLSYRGTRSREHVYGGKLVENAVQALCRDLMAGAMLAAERAGLSPVLTVHDEIVCDVDAREACASYERLVEIMMTLPTWAAGFPVGADGWVGFRYHK